MQTLFLDLVHDLRAKRLWPVAAVMLLALVAIPVVLMKPADDPAPGKSAAPRSPGRRRCPASRI